ncbi:MAG: diguanylate cyclase [Fimbriimonadaceae bacterium]
MCNTDHHGEAGNCSTFCDAIEALQGELNIGFWLWDVNSGRFVADATARRILNIGDDEEFETLSDFLAMLDSDIRELRETLESADGRVFEYDLACGADFSRGIKIGARPTVSESGTSYAGWLRDVTKALTEADQAASTFAVVKGIDQLKSSAWMRLNLTERRVIAVGETLVAWTGKDEQDLLRLTPKGIVGLLDSSDRRKALNAMAMVSRGKEPGPIRVQLIDHAGLPKYITLELSPLDDRGNVFLFATDIAVDLNLPGNSFNIALQSQLFSLLPELVYVYELASGRNIFASGNVRDYLGYDRSDLEATDGNFIDVVIHEQDRDQVRLHKMMLASALPGEKLPFEYRIVRKDGTVRILSGHDMPVGFDDREHVTQVMGVARDVTDERNAQNKLEKYVLEAHEAQIALEHQQYQMEILNDQLARSNEALMRRAQTDGLTQIMNRTALNEELEIIFKRALITGFPFAIIMADVDHFKRINDEEGHMVGDEVLVAFAKLLKENVKKGDIVARYGGEEFLLMIPGADETIGRSVAERLRSKIEQTGWAKRKVTASLGVCAFDMSFSSVSEMVDSADEALYKAKREGRNRVFAFSDLKDAA